MPFPRSTIVLMPGLDGTGDLFRPLRGVIPTEVMTREVRYPRDQVLSYAALSDRVDEQLRAEREVVLVAESFSGPIAIRYAAAHPEQVRTLVLCASFVKSPLPRWLSVFARPLLFRLAPPAFAVRRFMIGRSAGDDLVRDVRAAIGKVKPEVIAGRIREVFAVDCADALRRCRTPTLYLAADRDAFVRRSSVDRVRAARNGVVVRTVEAPHLILQAEPATAWEEISRFLRDVST